MSERFRLYAGMGRNWPTPLDEGDFIDDFPSRPAAAKHAERYYEKDWWVIFDMDTGKLVQTWSTGLTPSRLREIK